MPSCSSRRSNHCFARRFHPYALNPMAAFLFDDDDDDDMIPSATFLQQYTKNKARWNEEESNDSYTIDMDVPGVKLHQITVEETNGEIEITAIRVNNEGEVLDTYQDIFYVRPSAADLSNTTATLKDGVLTIKVPKKVYETVEVEIESSNPPTAASGDDNNEFRVSLDLPGVQISNVKLEFREDKLHMKATRHIGNRTVNMARLFEIPSTTDMTAARAFLQDGVFTLVAPNRVAEMEEDSGSTKTIPVLDGDAIPLVSALRLDDSNDETAEADGTAMVEGEKDWEEIEDDAKKPAANTNSD